MSKLVALVGLAIGGYIGFLNRPAAFLVGQLPFEKMALGGINLTGIDKVFISPARTSFMYMIVGAVLGLIVGAVLGKVVFKNR